METGAWRGEANGGHPQSTSGRTSRMRMIEPTSTTTTKA